MRPNVGADREGWITGRTLNGSSKADAADRQLRVSSGLRQRGRRCSVYSVEKLIFREPQILSVNRFVA